MANKDRAETSPETEADDPASVPIFTPPSGSLEEIWKWLAEQPVGSGRIPDGLLGPLEEKIARCERGYSNLPTSVGGFDPHLVRGKFDALMATLKAAGEWWKIAPRLKQHLEFTRRLMVLEIERALRRTAGTAAGDGTRNRRPKRTEADRVRDEGVILGHLKDHPDATRDQVAAATGISAAHVSASRAWKAETQRRKSRNAEARPSGADLDDLADPASAQTRSTDGGRARGANTGRSARND